MPPENVIFKNFTSDPKKKTPSEAPGSIVNFPYKKTEDECDRFLKSLLFMKESGISRWKESGSVGRKYFGETIMKKCWKKWKEKFDSTPQKGVK